MAKISLKLQGQLAQKFPGGGGEFEINQDVTLESFLHSLGLENKGYVVILNQTVAPARNIVLADKDKVVVYPQMAGG